MTDNEIIKALECCGNQMYSCTDKDCKSQTLGNALDLINRLKANEEKNENIIRLADKTIEKQQAEIEKLKKENDDLFFKLNGVMWSVDKWLDGDELKQDEVNRAIAMREKTLQIIEELQAEIETWQKAIKVQDIMIEQQDYKIKSAKSEARKEFAERFKEEVAHIPAWGKVAEKKIDNLLKEMEGEEDV